MSEVDLDDIEAPRKLRHKEDLRNIKDPLADPSDPFEDLPHEARRVKSGKKRRREKHERYSPELLSGSSKKHKKKKKNNVNNNNQKLDNLPRIKIKVSVKNIEQTQFFMRSQNCDNDNKVEKKEAKF